MAKIKGFSTLQPHWEHSGQKIFLYGVLAIKEIKYIFFSTHLSQFYKIF